MTLLHWKTVKWLAYVAGIYAIMQSVTEGADPLFGIVAVALILAGPEVLEYIAVKEDLREHLERQSADDED